MIKTYISTPMTGKLNSSIEEAFLSAEKYCTHEGLQPVYDKDWSKKSDVPWIDNMIFDLNLLKDCKMIIMMPGWEHSEGCKVEKMCANRMGILVKYFQICGILGSF